MINSILSKRNNVNQHLPIILQKLSNYLQKTYLQELDQVILFGSQARGEAQENSDIDILIVLKASFNDYQESQKNSSFISDLCLEYDVVITYFFATQEKGKTHDNAFFRNIRQEGIIICSSNRKNLLKKRAKV